MSEESYNFEHSGYLELMQSQQIFYSCDIYNVIRRYTAWFKSVVTQSEIARNEEFNSLSQCFKVSLVQLH